MKYKWKEKQLKNKLDIAKQNQDYVVRNNYKNMIGLMNGKLDLSDISIPKVKSKETYNTRYNRYHANIHYLRDEIIEFLASIFIIEENEDNLFEDIPYKNWDLTDKELLDLCYEILETLNDKDLLEVYKEIIDPHNHYLNIMNYDDFLSTHSREINGLTFYDKNEDKSYISIHRHYNIEDVKALVHEVMHAYFYKLYEDDPFKVNYFGELEGRFGNRLAGNYMLKHNMKHYGNELRIAELYDILNESYLLYLNNVLFNTQEKSTFRLKKATKVLRKNTGYPDTTIGGKDLPYICSINCLVAATEILDYLVCLEAQVKHYKPEYQLDVIKDVRSNDNPNYVNNLMPHEFDFFGDDVKALRRYKKDCERYIRYKN